MALFAALSANPSPSIGAEEWTPGEFATGVSLLAPQSAGAHGEGAGPVVVPKTGAAANGVDGGRCDHAPNKQLCLPPAYSKFELPFTDTVNVVEIGIDILDVLRINDKVSEWRKNWLADLWRRVDEREREGDSSSSS